jgi:hypothetical protein
MPLVEVFDFAVFSNMTGKNVPSPSMATRPVIRRLNGEIASLETGIEIDPSRLDGKG